jgi:hypothetical protein
LKPILKKGVWAIHVHSKGNPSTSSRPTANAAGTSLSFC